MFTGNYTLYQTIKRKAEEFLLQPKKCVCTWKRKLISSLRSSLLLSLLELSLLAFYVTPFLSLPTDARIIYDLYYSYMIDFFLSI